MRPPLPSGQKRQRRSITENEGSRRRATVCLSEKGEEGKKKASWSGQVM